MFAPEVERWLKSNSTPRYRQFVEGARSETAALLQDLGIPANSELAHFYTSFGVPAGFVALTGFEGEGVVLYALRTGEVYDVELHRLEQLLNGSLAPIAKTFEGYLLWCRSQQEKR